MLLSEYLNEQFSLMQNLEFIVRILVACLCGAGIGFERSKRFKEAGIRTHVIVCCGAALMMVVSKYGFADLTDVAGVTFNGTRGADPARIAAQVVSGISFLGAGVIFKHGSSVRGLTTAAGLWATAGIGLSVGAGMYFTGVFTTVLLALFQILMHKYQVGTDSMITSHLRFTVLYSPELQEAIAQFVADHQMQVAECGIKYPDDGYVSYDLTVRSAQEFTVRELERFLRQYGEVKEVGFVSLG